MQSIADALLAAGLVPNLETTHGESIVMLSGDDAGKSFVGVVSLEQDLVFTGDIGAPNAPSRSSALSPRSIPTPCCSTAAAGNGRPSAAPATPIYPPTSNW
jgi:hypothetical protein